MAGLKLDAMDADDLRIVSAYCQDGVVLARECRFMAREKRFVVAMNRFAWEAAKTPSRWNPFTKAQYERRRAILDFGRVSKVQSFGVAAGSDDVLVLLALRFEPTSLPAGTIELVFAGSGTIRLDVECVEARLTDEDAVWSTTKRPDHDKPDA